MNELNETLNIDKNTSKKILTKKYIKIKRGLDIIISLLSLILLSPLFIILSISIKISTKGKVFFTHTRIGKNGEKFKLYKFQTMYKNAEQMINNFTEEQKKEYKENYKLKNDPRITKVGKFIRKRGLDELPQLINILKGELSIIGPRPVIEEELEKYKEDKEKFLSIIPGLTGYWQVNREENTTYDERIKMELYYIDNISFKNDLKIFFQTFISIFK